MSGKWVTEGIDSCTRDISSAKSTTKTNSNYTVYGRLVRASLYQHDSWQIIDLPQTHRTYVCLSACLLQPVRSHSHAIRTHNNSYNQKPTLTITFRNVLNSTRQPWKFSLRKGCGYNGKFIANYYDLHCFTNYNQIYPNVYNKTEIQTTMFF